MTMYTYMSLRKIQLTKSSSWNCKLHWNLVSLISLLSILWMQKAFVICRLNLTIQLNDFMHVWIAMLQGSRWENWNFNYKILPFKWKKRVEKFAFVYLVWHNLTYYFIFSCVFLLFFCIFINFLFLYSRTIFNPFFKSCSPPNQYNHSPNNMQAI